MSEATITIDVSEALAKLDPAKMEQYLEAALDGAADLLRVDLKQYPPPPAASRYVRTGKLGQAWAKRVTRREAIVGNIRPYAPYVQDSDRQAAVHRGRWQTTRDVAERQKNNVKRFIEDALAKWAAR